ncbi:hypothetical protein PYW08_006686 [Mythimna loreyi]|uniref:Uncharacterized protein n=1 Tax=Mythimna loreyi TaxID=667449 RepID=A0ACC2R8A9_9NEOP|nr:hypothetical protein PYW08_006686 [Mythimna loreyi]
MKFMLIFASAVALVVASPYRGLVDPGAAGPAPAPELEPIAIGPAVLEYEPVAVGPEFVDLPTPEIVPPVAPVPVPVGSPLVQIILNINTPVSGPVVPQPPIEIIPEPVQIVDSAPEPVEIGPAILPEPVDITVPIVPYPAANLPVELN